MGACSRQDGAWVDVRRPTSFREMDGSSHLAAAKAPKGSVCEQASAFR
jgi:hypothetical protein